MLRKQHPAKTSFQERLGTLQRQIFEPFGGHFGSQNRSERGPKQATFWNNFFDHFLPPRGGGAPRAAHLGFGALLLEIAAGASAGCKIRGFRVSGATLGAGGRS